MRQSAIFAKVGALESSEATTQLTAVLNGFKMGAEDAAHVVDALSSVDLKAATSTRELSEALQYTSNSARGAGVEFEEIVGMIGSVSEATRLSSSMIGNAFKTLFARYGNIAAGKTIDDFGESINDVETVMRSLGIEIREDEDTFRSFMDVISEVAGKWDTLADTQKNQIATAMGGTRQREILMALLENWDRATELMDIAANSAGASAEKFEIYLGSIEAKTNELKAAFEGLVKSEGATNLFKGLIDLGAQLIKILDSVINGPAGLAALAGIITLLFANGNIIAGVEGFVISIGKITKAVDFASLSFSKLTTAFMSSPLAIATAVAAGVLLIAKAIDVLTKSSSELREEQQKTLDIISNKEAIIKALESRTDLTDAEKEYLETLKEEVKYLKERANIEGREAYEKESEERFKKYGQENRGRAGTGGIFEQYSYAKEYLDYIVSQKEVPQTILDSLKDSGYTEAQIEQYEQGWASDWAKKYEKAQNAVYDYEKQLKELGSTLYDLQEDGVDFTEEDTKLLNFLKNAGIWEEVVAEKAIEAKIKTSDLGDQDLEPLDENIQNLANDLGNADDGLKTITEELHNIQDASSLIGSVEGDIADSGQITLDTLDQIVERWPQMTDLVNQYLLGLSSQEEVLSALQSAYAVDEENAFKSIISKLKMSEDYYNYLKELDYNLIQQFNTNYGTDLNNHITYAQGKEQIENALVAEFDAIWREHFGNVQKGIIDTERTLANLRNHTLGGKDSKGSTKNYLSDWTDKYVNAMSDWEDVYDNSFVIQLTNQYKDLGTAARDSARAAQGASDAAAKAAEKARKQQEDYYNKLVELTVKMLKKEKELEKERLKDQLEGYKKLIDAQQKLLDKKDEEYKRDRELEDRNKAISQLEAQIAELQFDTSAEGIKKRLELEAELAEGKRELEDYQHDYSIDQQKDALDEEEDRYEDHINAQIKEIDRWLSETGKIYAEARRLIDEHADSTLQKLLEYNDIYGTDIRDTIIMWWNGATNAVYAYEMALDSAANAARRLASYTGGSGAPAYSVSGTGEPNKGGNAPSNKHQAPTTTINKGGNSASTKRIAVRHKGIDAGLIGGNAKGNEEFVKALKGEAFVTKAQQDKFMGKILPQMVKNQQKQLSNVSFNKLIDLTVNGNLDKTVLPDIESIVTKAVKQLNEIMFRNGNVKSTRSVSI